MRGHGLRIAVVAASPVVHETLEMANLGPLVPVVATREAALQALGVV